MWLLYVFIIIILSGVLDIIEKSASEKDDLKFWAFGCLTFGIFETILGLIFLDKDFIFSFKNLFLVLPVSLLSSIGYYFSVMAFKNGNVSKVSVVMRSKIIWVLILSSIFLPSERLKFSQIILVFIILLLNILLTYDKKGREKSLGTIYAFGYLFSNGSATFINKVVTDKISDTMSITFYSGITSIFSIVLILLLINKLYLLDLKKFKSKKEVLIMESLEVISMILLRLALKTGNVVIISSLSSCSIIIAILLAKIIFKEKVNYKKWLIIILTVLNLILLSYLSVK